MSDKELEPAAWSYAYRRKGTDKKWLRSVSSFVFGKPNDEDLEYRDVEPLVRVIDLSDVMSDIESIFDEDEWWRVLKNLIYQTHPDLEDKNGEEL